MPDVSGIRKWLRETPLDDDQIDLLRTGGARSHALNNLLAGHGKNVHALEEKGLLRYVGMEHDPEGYWFTNYVVTEAGRKAFLGSIGVREIAPDRP